MSPMLGPLLGRVRQDFQYLTRFMPNFQVGPELRSQQICMMLEERPPSLFRKTQELDELFRKDVMWPHIKPGGGPHLVHVVPSFRDPAEIAVCDEAKLVIVIKYDPTMSRQAKILE